MCFFVGKNFIGIKNSWGKQNDIVCHSGLQIPQKTLAAKSFLREVF